VIDILRADQTFLRKSKIFQLLSFYVTSLTKPIILSKYIGIFDAGKIFNDREREKKFLSLFMRVCSNRCVICIDKKNMVVSLAILCIFFSLPNHV
jgi:hypothetical protein